MAKIKSAVELAMEKTKSLHLSLEEKEKLKEEEFSSKTLPLLNRLREANFHPKEVEKELQKYSPEQRNQLEKLLFHSLAEAIQLEEENDSLLRGIELLGKEKINKSGAIQKVIEDYRKAKEKEYRRIEEALLMTLEGLGISGSAVQVKIAGSQEWEESLGKIKPAYENQLRSLKEALIQNRFG